MAETTIEERIKGIIAERLELKADQIVPDASLQEDLGADSLDAVELIMALEEEFGIDIPDAHAEELKTVGDVFSYIQDLQKK
ncbi:MAG: acyl carrier protein [Verrucomicrobiota bacterium]